MADDPPRASTVLLMLWAAVVASNAEALETRIFGCFRRIRVPVDYGKLWRQTR
jgi:hypothetical protein